MSTVSTIFSSVLETNPKLAANQVNYEGVGRSAKVVDRGIRRSRRRDQHFRNWCPALLFSAGLLPAPGQRLTPPREQQARRKSRTSWAPPLRSIDTSIVIDKCGEYRNVGRRTLPRPCIPVEFTLIIRPRRRPKTAPHFEAAVTLADQTVGGSRGDLVCRVYARCRSA